MAARKVLALPQEDRSLISPKPTYKARPGLVACTCNPSAGEVGIGRSLALPGQLASPTWGAQGQGRDPVSKLKVVSSQGTRTYSHGCPLASTNVHTHVYVCTHRGGS